MSHWSYTKQAARITMLQAYAQLSGLAINIINMAYHHLCTAVLTISISSFFSSSLGALWSSDGPFCLLSSELLIWPWLMFKVDSSWLFWSWGGGEDECGDRLCAALVSSSNKHIKSPETIPYEARVSWSSVRASLLFNVIANWVSELQRQK